MYNAQLDMQEICYSGSSSGAAVLKSHIIKRILRSLLF